MSTAGTYLNVIKAIWDKPTTKKLPNGEKLKVFLVKSGKTLDCTLSPLLFNIVLEILGTVIRQEEIKRTANWNGRGKIVIMYR